MTTSIVTCPTCGQEMLPTDHSARVIEQCAKICNDLYTNPPEAYSRFDLLQGWHCALDLAEQKILSTITDPAAIDAATAKSNG